MKKIEQLNNAVLASFIKSFDESYELEYKEIYGGKTKNQMDNQLQKSVLRTVGAFANSNVEIGRLILGVKDKTKEVNGVPHEITLEKLSDLINSKINPTPYFKIQEYEINQKKIIVIDTFQSNDRPYIVEGCIYKRMGHSSKIVTDYREIKSLEKTVIGKAREWVSNIESDGIPKLCYILAPIYTVRGEFEGDEHKEFLKGFNELGLKMLSINTQMYSTPNCTIEVDIFDRTIKVITDIETYHDTLSLVTECGRHLYGVYDEKQILFLSNILFNSNSEITLNGRTLQKGLNYVIEMKMENMHLNFPLFLNNYFSPEEADRMYMNAISVTDNN